MTALDTTPAAAPADGPHDRAALRTAIDATMQLAAAGAGPVRTAVREAMADAVTDLVAPILDRLATERNTMMTALESHQLNQRVGIVSVAQAVAATDEARRKDRRWKGAVAQARAEHARAEQLSAERDGAYRERAQLLALLTTHYPAVLAYNDPSAPAWAVVYLDLPTGQASWHIAPGDVALFGHVRRDDSHKWDGHSTAEKYRRIEQCVNGTGQTAVCGEAADLGESFGLAFGDVVTCTKQPHPADPWHQDDNHHGVCWRALDSADAPSADTDAAHGS